MAVSVDKPWWVNRIGDYAGATYDQRTGEPAYGASLDLGTASVDYETHTQIRDTVSTATQEQKGAWGTGVLQNLTGWIPGVASAIGETWEDLQEQNNPFGAAARYYDAVWEYPALIARASMEAVGVEMERASRTAATPFAASSIAAATADETGGDAFSRAETEFATMLDPATWNKAWESTDPRREQATSPARAVADLSILSFGLGTDNTEDLIGRGMLNPDDPDFLNYRATSNPYNIATGVGDFAYQWFLSPEVVGLAGMKKINTLSAGLTTQMRNPVKRKKFIDIATAADEASRDAAGFRRTSIPDRFAWRVNQRMKETRRYLQEAENTDELLEQVAGWSFARSARQGDTGAAAWVTIRAARSDDETWQNAMRAALGDERARQWLKTHQDPELRDALDAATKSWKKADDLLASQQASAKIVSDILSGVKKQGLDTSVLEVALTEAREPIAESMKRATVLSRQMDDLARELDDYERFWDKVTGFEDVRGREGLFMDAPTMPHVDARRIARGTYTWKPTRYSSHAQVNMSRVSKVWRGQPGVIELHRGDRSYENLMNQMDILERKLAVRGGKRVEEVMGADWGPRRAALGEAIARASTDTERRAAMIAADREAITRLGRAYGLEAETAEDVAAWLMKKRDEAQRAATEHVWSRATIDGKRVDTISEMGPDGQIINYTLPVSVSQLQNTYAMVDLEQLDKMLRLHGDSIASMGKEWRLSKRLRKADGTNPWDEVTSVGTHFLDAFTHLWKVGVLLRLGYPIRTVTDDGMRSFAAGAGLGYLKEIPYSVKEGAGRAARRAKRRAGKNAPDPETPQMTVRSREGTKQSVARAITGEDPMRAMASSSGAQGGQSLFNVQLQDFSRGRSMLPSSVPVGHKNYLDEWAKVLKGQVLADPVWRRMLAGSSDEEIAAFLRTDQLGQDILKRHAWSGKGVPVEDIVAKQRAALDYIAPDYLRDFMRAAMDGKQHIDAKQLDQVLARVDPELLPQTIDFGRLATVGGGSNPVINAYQKFVSTAFEILQRIPQDYLVRNPFYRANYKSRLRDLYSQFVDEEITFDMAKAFQRDAEEYALTQLRRYLFSLNENTEFTAMMRHFIPFGAAHAEAMKKWSYAFLDNPAGVYRVWGVGWANIGDSLFLEEVDQEGNPVEGKWSTETNLRFRIGEEHAWMLPGIAELMNDEGFAIGQISKGATNLLVQGDPFFLPGPGPLLTVPADLLFKRNPHLADSESAIRPVYDWLFPVGSPTDTWKLVAPTTVQRLLETVRTDKAFLSTETLVLMQLMQRFRNANGRAPNVRERADLQRRALDSATHIQRLRFLGSLTLPAQVRLLPGDYEFVEIYRRMTQQYGMEEGHIRFVEEYGWEYALWGTSMSTSTNNVPATTAGQMYYNQEKKAIQDYPDLGGYIVGPDAYEDEFNQTVYRFQQQQPTGPGRPEAMRGIKNPGANLEQEDVTEGWREYGVVKDWIRADMDAKFGKPVSMSSKAGEPYAQILRAARAEIAERFPAWGAAYGERDTRWGANFIDQFRAALADMEERDPAVYATKPWLAGMKEYIALNDYIAEQLEARRQAGGSGTLYSPGTEMTQPVQGNEDLAAIWEGGVAIITEENPVFARHIYDRALDRWAPVAVNP